MVLKMVLDYQMKPLLHPLSELHEDADFIIFMRNQSIGAALVTCESDIVYLTHYVGGRTIVAIDNEISPLCPHIIYQYLVSHHYDVNNLIGRKLAIKK